MLDSQESNNKGQIWISITDYWNNSIDDAIERNKEYIDFSVLPLDEFKQECIELLTYYFENEMLGDEVNFDNIVGDIASSYEMWND